MEPTRLSRLTEQQRACLRHVYAHRTSKEIAPLLGVEPGTVDQHVKAAMRVLGVSDRRSAARLLAESEGSEPIQPLVYQPSDVASRPDWPELERPIESGLQGRWSGGGFREEQAPFQIFSRAGAPTLPLPIGTTRPGDLNWPSRLAWIAAIAIGVALAFGALVSAVDALSRIVRG